MRLSAPFTQQSQAGVSLVEVMISMTIGMMIIITIGYAYVGASQTYRSNSAMAGLQQGARYAFDFMGKDIRLTGATGCSGSTRFNALTFTHNGNATDLTNNWYKNLFDSPDTAHTDEHHFGHPLLGYENSAPPGVGTTANTAGHWQRGDSLTILRVDESQEFRVTANIPGSQQFNLAYNANNMALTAGTIVLVTDCQHQAIFQISAAGTPGCTSGTCTVTINNGSNTGKTPSNVSTQLGVNGTSDYTFTAGSRLYRLQAASYYVSQNSSGEPALYRMILDSPSGGSVTNGPEELVEGIRDMQITYGVDTDSTADGVVNAYYNADGIVSGGGIPGTNTSERWQRVLSVRIGLLLSSTAGDQSITTTNQTLSLSGGTSFTDRRLKREFAMTVAVRNRLSR